jgi:mitogen-activated protein kinase kinase
LIELALGRFPFSDSDSDHESDSDLEATLSPSTIAALSLNDLHVVSEEGDDQVPLPPRRPLKRNKDPAATAKDKKKDKRRSKGVSLQGGGMTMSILELLQHIVNEPAPRLTEGRYPKVAEAFIDACLMKKPEDRQTPKELLVSGTLIFPLALNSIYSQEHDWIKESRESTVDLVAWANTF